MYIFLLYLYQMGFKEPLRRHNEDQEVEEESTGATGTETDCTYACERLRSRLTPWAPADTFH